MKQSSSWWFSTVVVMALMISDELGSAWQPHMTAPHCLRLRVWQSAWHLILAVGWGTERMCCASSTWLKYSCDHGLSHKAGHTHPHIHTYVLSPASAAGGHKKVRESTGLRIQLLQMSTWSLWLTQTAVTQQLLTYSRMHKLTEIWHDYYHFNTLFCCKIHSYCVSGSLCSIISAHANITWAGAETEDNKLKATTQHMNTFFCLFLLMQMTAWY